MDTPDLRILGFLRPLARWLFDLALAPGRIAAIAKAAEADGDARLACLACGVGRVSVRETRVDDWGAPYPYGVCMGCGAWWEVDIGERKIIDLAEPPRH